MLWPQRGSGVRLGGAELRSNAGRYALIAVCALIAYAGEYPRFANAEPSTSGSDSGYAPHAGYSGEQRAEELYLDGIEKLQAGHRDFARDTFEQLVARYPSSAAANDARRQLGELYHHDHSPAGSNALDTYGDARPALSVAPPESTGSISAPAISDMNALPDVQPARSKGWDQELRRNASIQSKLRIEAGDRVFFSPGSAELGSRARNALAAQAKWLMRWHEFEAAIEGHADEPGTEQENVVLSEQRAEAVRERLIQEGIQPSRLAVVPLGRSIPVATCADTDCRAQNRRAVTLVFATGTRDRLGLVVSGTSRAASAALVVPSATAVRAVEVPGDVQPAGVTR
jgi:outer membrane protein OmpA-like peptidoglycan-associated protein